MVIKYLGNETTPTRLIVAGRIIFVSVAALLHDVGDADFGEIERLFPGLFEIAGAEAHGEPVNPPTPQPPAANEAADNASAAAVVVGGKKRK